MSRSRQWSGPCVTRDLFMRVIWPIYMCAMARIIYVPWLIRMCAIMAHSYVCHDSFVCMPSWLIRMCAMTRSYVCRDSFVYVPWLIRVCANSHDWSPCHAPNMRDVTQSYVHWLILMSHDSLMCVTWLIHVWHDSFMCDMTPSYAIDLALRIHVCYMTPSYMI